MQLWFINLCILNLQIWSHTSFSSYPPTKLTTNLPEQSSIHWHNCARGSESFGLEIIMAPSLDVALVTMGWNPFSLIYQKFIPGCFLIAILISKSTTSSCVKWDKGSFIRVQFDEKIVNRILGCTNFLGLH